MMAAPLQAMKTSTFPPLLPTTHPAPLLPSVFSAAAHPNSHSMAAPSALAHVPRPTLPPSTLTASPHMLLEGHAVPALQPMEYPAALDPHGDAVMAEQDDVIACCSPVSGMEGIWGPYIMPPLPRDYEDEE
jgi:hypothetical protein